jgi:hypothetical protein
VCVLVLVQELRGRSAVAEAGWHHLLAKLAPALDGRQFSWSEEQRNALRGRYAAMLR